jgi:predicted NAD/FAD-binding protein
MKLSTNTKSTAQKRIAIIGSGISGLTCAYLLSRQHQVTLFETSDRLGGHTATVDVELNKQSTSVDTGFIVFNDRTYPNFIKLMNQIDIRSKPTEMSFSVHNHNNGLEYNGHNLDTLFAQRRNLLNPRFYKFVFEILRFNKLAKKFNSHQTNNNIETLGDFLESHKFSDYFANNYILAMVAAIWSSSINNCRDFPLVFFMRFFNNHGLLDIKNRPQWFVIKGGSSSYIPRLIQYTKDIRLSNAVTSVVRHPNHVEVTSKNQTEIFDEVIFACHSDQALDLLADANPTETNLLRAMEYRNNEVVLHTDPNLLPKRKKAHASWNYWIDSSTNDLPSVTYNMNILQGLVVDETVCITLNQTQKIDPKKILRQFNYSHPVFTSNSLHAQQQRKLICGQQHTHFCGAYWYNGFHEDGVKSALDVCDYFGITLDNNLPDRVDL